MGDGVQIATVHHIRCETRGTLNSVKICNACKQEKNLTEFNKKGSGHQPYCRACDNQRSRDRYHANPEDHKKSVLTRNRLRRLEIKEQIKKAKSVPCLDCGVSYPPYVMDFDHVVGTKLDNVANLVSKIVSDDRLTIEIEKCEVVCSNCHRIRTYNRQSQVTQLAE